MEAKKKKLAKIITRKNKKKKKNEIPGFIAKLLLLFYFINIFSASFFSSAKHNPNFPERRGDPILTKPEAKKLLLFFCSS